MADINEANIFEMINRLGGVEKFQRDPFAFIGEVFKHPDLLAQIDQLSKTPEMQKQIQESMNNPMFQQIVGNNPLLSGMMNEYKNRQGFTQNASTVDANTEVDEDDDDEYEDDEEEDDEEEGVYVNGFDFSIPDWKPVDWLNSVSSQPFYIPDDESKRIHFSDVLEKIPEECRESVEIIAEKRLQAHVNPLQMAQLNAIAESKGVTPLDLMATLGGFIGEVCYCATLVMPEEDQDLCDFAKYALASLHRRSGFPVSSYITQNLLYLDSYDDIEESDWMNFIWSLSGNPVSGRDGNFAPSWDDVSTIAEIAAENLADEPEMFLGVCLGMVGWSEVNIKDIEKPFQTLLDNFENKAALRGLIMNCLNGQKLYGMQLMSMRDAIKMDAVEFVIENDGLNAILEKAALWPASNAEMASVLVKKLGDLWEKADADRRDAFLMHATRMDSEDLAFAALNTGARFQPEKYRLMALDSQYESIKKRAETLGK